MEPESRHLTRWGLILALVAMATSLLASVIAALPRPTSQPTASWYGGIWSWVYAIRIQLLIVLLMVFAVSIVAILALVFNWFAVEPLIRWRRSRIQRRTEEQFARIGGGIDEESALERERAAIETLRRRAHMLALGAPTYEDVVGLDERVLAAIRPENGEDYVKLPKLERYLPSGRDAWGRRRRTPEETEAYYKEALSLRYEFLVVLDREILARQLGISLQRAPVSSLETLQVEGRRIQRELKKLTSAAASMSRCSVGPSPGTRRFGRRWGPSAGPSSATCAGTVPETKRSPRMSYSPG